MRRRTRVALLVAVALIVAVLGGAAIRDAVNVDVAETTIEQQAAPLDRLCQTVPGAAAEAGANCAQAAAIARDGVDGATVVGSPGRGVLGTRITPAGRLVVSYSDGEVVDVGQVVGAAGEVGPEGRGIAGTVLDGGRLLVTFTDGEVVDLGAVVGAAGRGIASTAAVDGRLLITYTDGDVEDAGPLPAGPRGETGDRGAAAPSVDYQEFRFPDGTVTRCPRSGGPDTAPVFDCERSAPPAPPDEPADPVEPPADDTEPDLIPGGG